MRSSATTSLWPQLRLPEPVTVPDSQSPQNEGVAVGVEEPLGVVADTAAVHAE